MKKIERLTPDQIAMFPEYVKRWTDIGLSTAPADRPAAEAAIVEMYRCGGLEPPEKIAWCGSPLSQGMTRAIVLEKGDKAIPWASVGDSVGDSVRASVRASVGDSVGDSVWDSVRASVGDSVRASVGDSVRASVGDSVWDSVGDSVYGAHEAGWLSFYALFREQCGLTVETDKLAGLFALAKSAGWALPHRKICWVSERHQVLQRNAAGRLHCVTGPAVLYPDGWAIYAVNGVRVPSKVIEAPESYTADEIRAEQNSEVTRVLAERLGWEKFLGIIGSVSINKWIDPKTGLDYELLDTPVRKGEQQPKLLKMRSPVLKDGTAPYYIEPVAAGLQTAQAARKWQCVDWKADPSELVRRCNESPELTFGWEA